MKPDTAFNAYQTYVNADPDHVKEARRRRDVFRRSFGTLSEVLERVPSGSLARGTQRDPIHDVDMIMIFNEDNHKDWDTGSGSAEAALEYTRSRVNVLLGTNGTFKEEVRFTTLRNHVVKCFLDDPDDPNAFVVEVMPALRSVDGTLRIPEKLNDHWVTADPEYLIKQVASRHAEWRFFAPMVRVIKEWKDVVGLDMKSLVAEVLALNCLPRPTVDIGLTRQVALKSFFIAAAPAVMGGVVDPANRCGEIQPDLDRNRAYDLLSEAAELAAKAVDAELNGGDDSAVEIWGEIFGKNFPKATVSSGPRIITPIPARRPFKEAPQG
jgi:hypothetical protein